MNPKSRPLTPRQHLSNLLQEYRKLKVELKRDVQFAKESLKPYPCVKDFIINHENLIQQVEKKEWELQMRSELLRIKGRR